MIDAIEQVVMISSQIVKIIANLVEKPTPPHDTVDNNEAATWNRLVDELGCRVEVSG